MKKFLFSILIIVSVFCLCACGTEDEKKQTDTPKDNTVKNLAYNFENGDNGFEAIFADYGDDGNNYETYEMKHEHKSLPVGSTKGLYLSAYNRSDDLFMGYVKKITGLEKNKNMKFDISFKIATNAEDDSFGAGGSPATSVYVKAGVVNQKPKVEKDSANIFRFSNIDVGRQSNGGKDAKVIGNLAKPEKSPSGFVLKPMNASVNATSNNMGEVWLLVGTDSGYEGLSEYYIDDVMIKIS